VVSLFQIFYSAFSLIAQVFTKSTSAYSSESASEYPAYCMIEATISESLTFI